MSDYYNSIANNAIAGIGTLRDAITDRQVLLDEAIARITTLERELAEAKASLHNAEQAATSLSWAKAKAENERNDMFCQLTAANATIAACKDAGFIDAEGRVRKVIGTLPLTADNCIAGFPPGTGGLWYKMPSGHVMQTDPRRMVYEQSSRCVLTWLAGYGDVLVSACYSTPAAAREAQ